jgi:hypothetical protein
MEKDNEIKTRLRIEAGRRLRDARKVHFARPAEAIREHGWKKDTYLSHEAGKRQFDRLAAERYARAYGVTVEYLLGLDGVRKSEDPVGGYDSVSLVPVYGRSAGGVWMESEITLNEDDVEEWVPASEHARPTHQYARRVVGNSVSRQIPDGFFAIFVKREFYPGPIPFGKLVDVHRVRGGMHEYSVKAYYGDQLKTDSAELDEQTALPIDLNADGDAVYIEGVAIGAYRDLP